MLNPGQLLVKGQCSGLAQALQDIQSQVAGGHAQCVTLNDPVVAGILASLQTALATTCTPYITQLLAKNDEFDELNNIVANP